MNARPKTTSAAPTSLAVSSARLLIAFQARHSTSAGFTLMLLNGLCSDLPGWESINTDLMCPNPTSD